MLALRADRCLYTAVSRREVFPIIRSNRSGRVINLGEIEKRYEAGETVDNATLHKKGLIKGNTPVKILGNGAYSKKLSFKVDAISASAKEKVEKAGGDVTVMPAPEKVRPKNKMGQGAKAVKKAAKVAKAKTAKK